MESVVRQLVKEEVKNALEAERGESSVNSSVKCAVKSTVKCSVKSSVKTDKPNAKRLPEVQTRLSNLLTKITKKCSAKKDMKLQIRWLRCTPDNKEPVVKPANGGGYRFVTLTEPDMAFHMLLDKAKEVYFLNGFNGFGEHLTEVDLSILDQSHLEVDLLENVKTFLTERGLFPSRTWFFLKTSAKDHRTSNEEEHGEDSDRDDILEIPAFKRKLCSMCSRTYLGLNCIHCIQDAAEYQESLIADQQCGPSNVPEISDGGGMDVLALREKRLQAFNNKQSTFDDDIVELTSKLIKEEPVVTLKLRRRNVLNDMISKMKIFFNNQELCRMNVEFLSFNAVEAGVDTGGPSREAYSILYDQAVGPLLQGPTGKNTFVHDLERVNENDFFAYGQIISARILHNYGYPHQFCNGVASYVLGLPGCYCSIEDIPDADLCEKLHQLNSCNNSAQFRILLREFPERYACGLLAYSLSFDNKEEIVRKIAHHCIISANLEEIQQFCEGLAKGGVLDLLKKYPKEAKIILMYSDNLLTAENLKALFRAELSKDQEKATAEEDILFNLHNFIDEVGLKKIGCVLAFTLEQVEDGVIDDKQKKEKVITLRDVLRFFTGYTVIPKSLKGITINFKHGHIGHMTVNTCKYEANFPISDLYQGDEFSKNLVYDIINSPGFGQV